MRYSIKNSMHYEMISSRIELISSRTNLVVYLSIFIRMLKQKNNELFEENLQLQKSSKSKLVERKPNSNETHDQPQPIVVRSKSIDPQLYSRSIRSARFTEKEGICQLQESHIKPSEHSLIPSIRNF